MYKKLIICSLFTIIAANRFGVFFNRHFLSKAKNVFPNFFICPKELEPYELEWFFTAL